MKAEDSDLNTGIPEAISASRSYRKRVFDVFQPERVEELIHPIVSKEKPRVRSEVERMLEDLAEITGLPLGVKQLSIPFLSQPRRDEFAGQTVMTTDNIGIEIRADRNLQSPIVTCPAGGAILRLAACTEVDGREWVQVEAPSGVTGFALAASIRSRCVPAKG
jgi:hypothetical protein